MTDNPNDREQESTPASSLRSKRKLHIVIFIAVAAALIAGGWWYFRYVSYGQYMQSTDNAYVAADSVVVSSKVAGYVDKVLVSENDQVNRGEALVQLDLRDYDAQAQQARAQIAATLAGADTIRSQVTEQDAAIRQAQAQLAAKRATLDLANGQVARYRPLAATGAEPREKLEQYETQAQQARAEFVSAQAAVSAATSRRGTLFKQIGQAQAQSDAARAQLEAADLNVTSTLLRASKGGRVGDLSVRVGQFVQPGQRLMTVVPVKEIYVTANFKETQVGLMRAGQSVRLEVDALPDFEIAGRVDSISPGTGAEFSVLPPENATGNFTKIVQRITVRIAIEASPKVRRLLVPGMSVVATVDTRNAAGELKEISSAAK
ncbi:MAG TPA: HlyD family secretion protein [Sphingorhabdus lacus]|jgi:membrane fusion protein (multidrug efflux system)|uniref:HlyD family secretion protein n=1 Tax=Sphingorhabdus sp. TaxID=1902408 RepID=UPI000BD9077C|nr:HlyD family secretion protein [Sphingorhabdus sp.]MBA4307058.1 multidrug ABC transporter permease [Sphingopyxis sp.]OYY16973.1 MAG: multidrug ABC transporter permease [Sphingomonadales bacterium 35-56-22]OYY99123.1 MAG: multidrug ABC transporter permease [Sphingomonadales bacterium 28-56-43]OYZ61481.1 MAG: multidrug ABC transporter permease [Sphingomonadales bacterium 24-56-14]OZA83482.1 MAG: multidrug ABC transporter permease [Sphingomonadales bacterium 39-57-19]HNW17263.1 HlyD family sec